MQNLCQLNTAFQDEPIDYIVSVHISNLVNTPYLNETMRLIHLNNLVNIFTFDRVAEVYKLITNEKLSKKIA